MGLRAPVAALGAVLLLAACSGDEAPQNGGPSTAPLTTADTTTVVPGSPSTTGPPPTTSAPPGTTIPVSEVELRLEVVADGFDQPVLVTHAGDERLFVLDQPGRIWVIGDGDPEVFLDIRADVTFRGEQGLLGLAFHPEFAVNGLFYVDYTDGSGDTRIVEFTVSSDPDVADPGSGRTLLRVPQPAGNHNGGMLAFGPDGNLWVGLGDGGGANDRYGNGQRGDTLLATILRLTVGPGIDTYEIPEGNGFEAPEVWAIGLRNPWRFAFDGEDLWIADVGQRRLEEIDLVSTTDRGLNFGWPIMEGTSCFQSDDCDPSGLVLPVSEYGHDEGCSITGGYVYRGGAIPSLEGHYFFSDYCTGFIRSIAPDGSLVEWTDRTGAVPGATSFGLDRSGEIYVTAREGVVYRLVAAPAT